ncbi:tyrosine-type recombinase/integrase [Lysinibacillus sp. JNUCC 51]|nr:tyrosine-type recombinase/integrase [Lysinibacillus sp. JNUCC-51]
MIHWSWEPIAPNNTAKIMYKIIQRTRLPQITLHGLRHTHCTILLNRGLNVKVIAERLGNTPKMIYEIYGHVLKEAEEASVVVFRQSLNERGASS